MKKQTPEWMTKPTIRPPVERVFIGGPLDGKRLFVWPPAETFMIRRRSVWYTYRREVGKDEFKLEDAKCNRQK